MKYLTSEKVLKIHDKLVIRFGGSLELRDKSLLESALARPQATFGGEDLYPTIFEKAAALMHSLLKNHPFVDGNKRTALTSTGVFLELNGYQLINTHKRELEFALAVENGSLEVQKIAHWLKNHTEKV